MKVEFLFILTHVIITRKVNSASVKAPLDVINLDDLTPYERHHLEYLNKLNNQRDKRESGHSLLSILAGSLKSKLGSIAEGSAGASGHLSSGSSGGGYHDHHPDPHHDEGPGYDQKSFDIWGVKKGIFSTLLQAAKAIKGLTIALAGKLIKGSGYLVAAKGKLITTQGDAVSNLGKKIASSAILSSGSQHYHGSDGYTEHHHDDYHHHHYGPSGHNDVEVEPSGHGPHYDHYKPAASHSPEKYTNFEDPHKTLQGLPAGILILKKIPRQAGQESNNVPVFKPLKPRQSSSSPTFTNVLTKMFSSSSHYQPQVSETVREDQYTKIPSPEGEKIPTGESIKPVQEELSIPTNDNGKIPQISNTQLPIKNYNFNSFPNELIDVPQDYSDFNTHPGFYLNNLAANVNTLPASVNNLPNPTNFDEFQTQFSQDIDTQFPTKSLDQGNLYVPRTKNKNQAFLPTPITGNPKPINHNTFKLAPSKSAAFTRTPFNYDLVKSLAFQLGPQGPVKI